MITNETATHDLTHEDINKIKQLSVRQTYKQDSLLFTEGDTAEFMYFIESGCVSIFIQQFTHQKEICRLGPGEYFGEMAFFGGDQRSASATTLTHTTLLSVDKASFLSLLDNDKAFASRINDILTRRNEELTLKENLIESLCVKSKNLRIGIKGDPSLRESAFTRDRYESVVDQILPVLQPHLYDLLMNRCVFELVIHFNSGEIHVRSIFNPLVDEIHPANKLTNKAYIERHFPPMEFQEKIKLARRLYAFIADDAITANLPHMHKEALLARHDAWDPMSLAGIPDIISRLPMLRKMQDFYMRNITISIVEDAVRMQFNCDGAHIISSNRYQEFLNSNVPIEEPGAEVFVERRETTRRNKDPSSVGACDERRCPPGRRQTDWDRFITELQQQEHLMRQDTKTPLSDLN